MKKNIAGVSPLRRKLYQYITIAAIIAQTLALPSCSVYSFSGSTLPGHIKTVELPVFENKTLEPGINDDVTTELSREVMSSQLRPANEDADAVIRGAVTRYTNQPHTFGAGGTEVNVEQYIVKVSAEVEFYDNRKNEQIYKGTVSGDGLYNFETEDEQTGRTKAIKDLVEKIFQNSVQIW
ncbi:MAG: DUF4136 domain-containing protein [Chitinispirillia bacterium]|nr:DUF4136 domain-containing protein [Chitinispirillia bacterium]MCL2242820.1 DUF4136 domain-containing protein [Chitinispirillia bacterium]